MGVSAGAAQSTQTAAGDEPRPAAGLPGDALHHGLDGRDEGERGRRASKPEV